MQNEHTWQGIISPEPPTAKNDHEAILEQAQQMLATRKKKLPYLVHQRKMKKDEANRQIAIFTFIVEDWQWIVSGEGQPACGSNLQERKKQLDNSLQVIAQIAADDGGFADPKLQRQAQLVIAMRWHLEPRENGRDVHWFAELNHELAWACNGDVFNG